jgi:hypothetical protein
MTFEVLRGSSRFFEVLRGSSILNGEDYRNWPSVLGDDHAPVLPLEAVRDLR